MDTTPTSRPLKALLSKPSALSERPIGVVECGWIAPAPATLQAVRAKHPRQGWIIDAIAQVLRHEGDYMQARDVVHAAVQTLLGEPVRWASVKATLAGNLHGPAPRFVRVARGRYGIPLPSDPMLDRGAPAPTRHIRAPNFTA